MTTALPVLLNLMADEVVDCEPYRLKAIRKSVCAERYLLASGFGGKRENGTAKSEISGQMKQSKCRHCPVGERRAGELGQVKAHGPVKTHRTAPDKSVIRTANVGFELSIDRESAHPQAGVVAPARNEDEEEGTMKKCALCGKRFTPTNNRQKFCTPGTGCRIAKKSRAIGAPRAARVARVPRVWTPSTKMRKDAEIPSYAKMQEDAEDRGDVSTPAKASPFLIWVQLQDRIDERKRIAAESIAAAELDLARFEEQHPEVLRAAVERYERAKSKALPAPPESALPPPETESEFAAHLASTDSEE